MKGNEFIRKYNAAEDRIIKEFNKSAFYQKALPSFIKKEFEHYLLQLGHLSFEFVKFLERAKLGLKTENGKEAIRAILRDEIPPAGPTHQDNRLTDLRSMGLPLDAVLNTPPTKETKETINEYYKFIHYPTNFYDVRVIAFVRVIGEVLVGETYAHVVEQMQKHFGIKPDESAFYFPHWKHDAKGGGAGLVGKGHTEYYDAVLLELITDEKTCKVAIDSAIKALAIRDKFHLQFVKTKI